jgi:hypothetical protein
MSEIRQIFPFLKGRKGSRTGLLWAGFKRKRLGRSQRGLHWTETEFADFTKTSASIKSRKICISNHKKNNSVAVVHKRTIPTERPPLVGEVSANFCGSAQRIPMTVNLSFLDRNCYFFIHVAPKFFLYFSENLSGPGIEPGTIRSVARISDH